MLGRFCTLSVEPTEEVGSKCQPLLQSPRRARPQRPQSDSQHNNNRPGAFGFFFSNIQEAQVYRIPMFYDVLCKFVFNFIPWTQIVATCLCVCEWLCHTLRASWFDNVCGWWRRLEAITLVDNMFQYPLFTHELHTKFVRCLASVRALILVACKLPSIAVRNQKVRNHTKPTIQLSNVSRTPNLPRQGLGSRDISTSNSESCTITKMAVTDSEIIFTAGISYCESPFTYSNSLFGFPINFRTSRQLRRQNVARC